MSTLPRILLEGPVRQALLEDLGRAGDLTSDAIVGADQTGRVALVARDHGVVAGLDAALLAFELIDPTLTIEVSLPDGSPLTLGSLIATVAGSARSILTAERVALNFLGHLSGVATATAGLVAAVAGTSTAITCTRKTTRVCEPWRRPPYAPVAESTTGSGSTTPFSSRTTTLLSPVGSPRRLAWLEPGPATWSRSRLRSTP